MANGWRDDRGPWDDARNRDRYRYGAEEAYGRDDFERDFADYGPFRADYRGHFGRYEPNLPYGSGRLGSSQRIDYGDPYRRGGPGGYGGYASGGYGTGRYEGGGYGVGGYGAGGYGRPFRNQERYGDFNRGPWSEWGEPSWGRPDYEGSSGESHYSRGPRGYTRSDERIREDLNDRLTDDWRVDATDIEVQVSKCEVTLNGTVDSREAKRRAEDIADSVSGVRHVQNNLRVRDRSPSRASTEAPSGTMAGSTTQGRH